MISHRILEVLVLYWTLKKLNPIKEKLKNTIKTTYKTKIEKKIWGV